MPNPRLTIAIPTLNRAYCVERALQSALQQTYSNIEILVSDNGSRDGTLAILEKYHDERLRIFHHEHTIPAPAHGNFLVEQARGEFFLGLSDDDYIEPEFAAEVLDLFDRTPDLSFTYTGGWIHYADAAVSMAVGPSIENGEDFLAEHFSGKREVCWCACVTRVADLHAIGPIPEGRIFGDMFYWTQIAFKGKVGCVNKPLSHYTFVGDNLSSGTPVTDWARETQLLADQFLAKFGETCNDSRRLVRVASATKRYVARSVANQFVWNSLHLDSRTALFKALWQTRAQLARNISVWPRVAVALAVPKTILRAMVIGMARHRARQRQACGLIPIHQIDSHRNDDL